MATTAATARLPDFMFVSPLEALMCEGVQQAVGSLFSRTVGAGALGYSLTVGAVVSRPDPPALRCPHKAGPPPKANV